MKKTLISAGVTSTFIALLLISTPVFAESTTTNATSTTVRKAKKLEGEAARLQSKANTEIDRRIAALTKMSSRIAEMKRVSAAQKNSFTATIQGQITLLNNLKTKIMADTDLATLKTDVQSITKAYRIYALLLPQIAITAAADRLSSTTDQVAAFETKLQARVATAAAAGKDTSSFAASFTEMTAKIADARTQITNAINGVVNLKPDNGDKTIQASNEAALKTARNAVKTGIANVKAAYKIGVSIRASLKKIEKTNATSTPQTATTTTP